MLRLTSFFRLLVVASLVLASFLFPTLHFHFIGDHDHDTNESHRHGIVHAHFLVALADGRQPGIHHDDIASHEHGNEIGLVALTSHKVTGSDQPFHKQLYYLADQQRVLFIATFSRAIVGKPDSPPHLSEFRYLGSPRSPPRFV